jgi:hypothetical protein
VQAVCDVVATLYRLKRSLLVLKGDFIGSANNESVHNKEACQIGDLGCAAKPMVDENSECEAARCLLAGYGGQSSTNREWLDIVCTHNFFVQHSCKLISDIAPSSRKFLATESFLTRRRRMADFAGCATGPLFAGCRGKVHAATSVAATHLAATDLLNKFFFNRDYYNHDATSQDL